MIHGWVGGNIRTAGTTKIAFNDHVSIYEAIAASDPQAARERMARTCMQAATRRLLASRTGDASRRPAT
jgi:DNA-binding FadR family transcriptional regulator